MSVWFSDIINLIAIECQNVRRSDNHIALDGHDDLSRGSFPSRKLLEENETYKKGDEVNADASCRHDTVDHDILEISHAGGMCLVSRVGDPCGYKMEPSSENLSKLSEWGNGKSDLQNDGGGIVYKIILTIWIIEVPEFLQVSHLKCPLKVDWEEEEMLDRNETNLTARLGQYEDFLKLYHWCSSPELVFSINDIKIEKDIKDSILDC